MKTEVTKTVIGIFAMLMIIGWAGRYDYEEQVKESAADEAVAEADEEEGDSATRCRTQENPYTYSFASCQ